MVDKKKFSHKDYKEERKLRSNFAHDYSRAYERTILTLSASFLAFSITLLRIITSYKSTSTVTKIIYENLLILSWITFAISVLAILISFVTKNYENNREIKIAEEGSRKGKINEKAQNMWSSISLILDAIAGMTFIIGIIAMITFASFNMQRSTNEGVKYEETSKKENCTSCHK